MTKPKQRQEALARSEQLIKEMQEAQKGGEESIAHLLDGDSQTEKPTPAAAEGKDDGQENTPPASKQEAPEQGSSPPAPETNNDWQARYEQLEHTHKVLKGKYNAEVQPLHEQIRQLRNRTDELEAALREKESKANTEIDGSLKKLEEVLLDEFPEEVVNAMMKLAQANKGPDPQLQKRLDRVESMTREQRLEARVPDWREIQAHPQWVPYLQERNPESGLERNDHLQHAWANDELPRVQAIFDAFRSRVKTPPKPTMDAPPAEPQSRSSAPRSQSGDKTFTQAEINAFYKQLNNRQLDIRDPKVRALRDSIEEFVQKRARSAA